MRTSIMLFFMLFQGGNLAVAGSPNCSNADDQTAFNQCAVQSFKESDRKLNDTYRALQKKISKEGKEKLTQAQRAWLAWRDAQCEFNSLGRVGGSAYTLTYAACLTRLSDAQVKELNRELHCEEGNLSCGGQ